MIFHLLLFSVSSLPIEASSMVSLIVFIQVYRLRLLGDYHHSSRIAFVEFAMVVSFSLFLFISF